MIKEIVIGSRGSRLALRQASLVREAIEQRCPGIQIAIATIRTSGDRMPRSAFSRLTASIKGLFVKEIEEALLQGRIDVAVHSLKDLPAELPSGLCLGAIPEREDPRDVLVTGAEPAGLEDLKKGARVGTSSLRRRVQLHFLRPDLSIQTIRGNVDTRIRKMAGENLDGIVLAAAGLKRLELEHRIACFFAVEEMVPAIGQGALAVEVRSHDTCIREVVELLNHAQTSLCVTAERNFLQEMGGGCQVPMGAHACLRNGKGFFCAFVGSPSRNRILKESAEGDPNNLKDLAMVVAARLLSKGAHEILKEISSSL